VSHKRPTAIWNRNFSFYLDTNYEEESLYE
jgi:hypothetical protein